MSTTFLVKNAHKIPELTARTFAGDVTAMAVLAVLGAAAAVAYVKSKK